MDENLLKDVIVVGGGVSGLCSVKLLNEKGIKNSLVLEANNCVGGRTYTIKNNDVKYVDLGGSYIGVTQNHLNRLIREFNIKTYKIDETSNILFYNSNKNLRFEINQNGPFKIGNFIENLDVNNFLRKLDELGAEIDLKEPWNCARAKELDRMSVQEFINQTCSTKICKLFAKNFVNLNVTCEPYESSLLWFAWYIKQCGGVKRIVSTRGGGQDSKTIGGMQQLSLKLVERIGEEKIKLNDAVIYINYDFDLNGIKCCQIKTISGKMYYTKKIILAIAPSMQNKITFVPSLCSLRTQLIQRFPMGTVMKCIIYYETSFWKKMGYCGSILQLGEDPEKTPFFYTLDDTKPDGSKPSLIGFILADKFRALINKNKEERKNLIAKSLYNVFRNELALYPCHYEEHTMIKVPSIGGCYTSFAPPGFLTNFGHLLRQNIDKKIFFASTETSFNWSGYINGAIDAGERAAREILCDFNLLDPKDIYINEPYLDDYPKHKFNDSFYEKYAPSVKGLINFCLGCTTVICLTGLVVFHKRCYIGVFNVCKN